jgi:hypothetical protein
MRIRLEETEQQEEAVQRRRRRRSKKKHIPVQTRWKRKNLVRWR